MVNDARDWMEHQWNCGKACSLAGRKQARRLKKSYTDDDIE